MDNQTQTRHVYLVGGGIASLASAAYLLRDCHLSGDHIHIFELSTINGGSLDGGGDAERGYVIRGGRMLNFSYLCGKRLIVANAFPT
jgi:oleate hydratase